MYEIEANNVTKKFGDFTALDDVSLKCSSGRIYGIVGHNGSGKTVFFKCICGFLKCTSGSIKVRGKLVGKDVDIINDAGVIIEEPAFIRKWSAFKNLDYLYRLNNKKNKNHIFDILEKVGLDPSLKRPVVKYSLGMRQRLAIAQSIMENPGILILDEPMNGLDGKGVSQMRSLFLSMREMGKTIILASHNKDDIAILCDEIYKMENGKLSLLCRSILYSC